MDVIIIGAGASGLMCAIEAGKRKRSVILLDHANRTGNKILISGGGRSNFTNLNISSGNYLSYNPEFCKSAIARFTPEHFIAMIKEHSIKYTEKERGQLFCRGKSSQIINMLELECRKAGVEVRLNCSVREIKKQGKSGGFIVATEVDTIESCSLVVATGGLSYKQLWASGIGYRIARDFGLNVTPLKPALVPLTFKPREQKFFKSLSGISMNVTASCRDRYFRGDILFTHSGLSGPAILQISSYWEKGDSISVNLLPERDVFKLIMSSRSSKILIKNLLSGLLPKRFAHTWCDLYIKSLPLNQYSEKELRGIVHLLQNWTIQPAGTEGYEKAEVTLGGVDTDELSSKTMESKKVPGLYFIGEVVDITGQLGGYNLHWAWASGHAAGQYV